MSEKNRWVDVELRIARVESSGEAGGGLVSRDEYRELAAAYRDLAQRFAKVLDVSDKYRRVIDTVEYGTPRRDHSEGAGGRRRKGAGAAFGDDEFDAVVSQLREHEERDVRTLARRYGKLKTQLAKVMSISDVYQSQLRETTLQLEMMARTDTLTELSNRRDMTERLVMEAARTSRHGGSYGIAIFDIDNFKRINDTYGHDVGDRVLVSTARSLRSVLRTSDACARWGGEEFLVLYPRTDLTDAQIVADRCRRAVAEMDTSFRDTDGRQTDAFVVTVSGGVCAGADSDWEAVVRAADEALYAAKNAGKNRVVISDGT